MRSTQLVLEQRASLALGLRYSPTAIWLSLSLLAAALHAALGLIDGFGSPYAIQTDARQYVTWMVRYQDPSYFPNDVIADYFHAVSPPGYRALFWSLIAGGADPFIVAKLVPVALGLAVTAYAFGLCLRLLPSAPAAFVVTVILNQNLWMTDDLISATPRAFGFPILVAFLYYLARRSLAGTVVTVALGGLFSRTANSACGDTGQRRAARQACRRVHIRGRSERDDSGRRVRRLAPKPGLPS